MLAIVPAIGVARSEDPTSRLLFAIALVAGVVQLVIAAFVYIPGFDPLFRVPWRGPRAGRRMAITFDDGPNGAVTAKVLDLFRRHGGKATFFMVGKNVEAEPAMARRVAADGHAVGSHTYSHCKLSAVPLDVAIEEIDRGRRCLAQAGIADTTLFRAPKGHKRLGIIKHLHRRGMRLIAWTSGIYDTDRASGDVLARRAGRWLKPGSILLLHDGLRGQDRRAMLEALEAILTTARERNLELVTIPELLGTRPPHPLET